MSRNIELKARCPDLASAEALAQQLGAALHSRERQHDTYFHVSRGRLKLRRRWLEGKELQSELIWYERPDLPQARSSGYTLVRVDCGEALRAQLANALGIAHQVDKQRTVYLHDNVRIHLDTVAGRGTFLEFEAIVDGSCDDRAAHAKIAHLQTAFGITPEQVLSSSYAEI